MTNRKKKPRMTVGRALLTATIAVGTAHVISMLTADRHIHFERSDYVSDCVSEALVGYRIAFISDSHAISMERLAAAMQELADEAPDILLLGGDYALGRAGLADTMKTIATITPPDGIYGIEGNHDSAEKAFAVMRENGITPLSNSGVRVRDGLYIAGVEDLWNRSPDVALALSGAADDDFRLLLAHNPDVAMLDGGNTAELMLCGHTHGGHVTLFGVWAPALAHTRTVTAYGQRFFKGWAKSASGGDVYVSRGIGAHRGAPRVYANPEVTIITLRRG